MKALSVRIPHRAYKGDTPPIPPRKDGRTDGRTDRRTDGREDGRMDGKTDGRTGAVTDGRTDYFLVLAAGRMDGKQRTDGRTE